MSKKQRKHYGPASEKQRILLQDMTTDVVLAGGGAGSSKSYSCLIKALKYVEDPAARVFIVRETVPVLKLPGGLIDESQRIYSGFGAEYKIQAMMWKFPNGAEIAFRAIPDNLLEWQGLQATNILVDEAAGTAFNENNILFLLSRLRGAEYKGKLNLTMTCNPDKQSFLFKWVEYSLDPETGIPMAGTEDKIKWFVNLNGKMCWADSIQELYEKHGAGLTLGVDFIPMSFRFIPMTIKDNPILIKNNPGYMANLLAQPRVNQLRYLHGSWTARPENSSYFSRDWIEFVDRAPVNPVAKLRSYDLGATKESEVNKDPDYTAGVLMSRDKMGSYYIEHVVRFRETPDNVLKKIVETAIDDGLDIPVTIPRDPGAGGKTANMFNTRTLAEAGLIVRSVPTPTQIGKLQRFLPFCALAEGGSVKIVRGDWNDEYLEELEFFVGKRGQGHDDQVDGTSDAFNTLCKQIQLPTIGIPTLEQGSPVPGIN